MRKKKEAKWEREKSEIKVGDIFCSCIGDRFIVTKVNEREFYILWYDGSTGHESKSKFDIQYYKKVGHIDINTWLTQIQTGGDDNE